VVSGRDVLVISNVDWHPLWQAPQEVASRLGRAGNRVVFLENTGIRAPRARDARRVAGRLASWARAARHRGLVEVAPGVLVASPLVLPPFGSRLRRWVNRRVFLTAVRRRLSRLGFRDPIVIAFLPTDTVLALYDLLRTPGSVLVDYSVADFTLLAPEADAIRANERRLVAESHVLLAGSAELGRRLGTEKPVHVFPPSVNLELFPVNASPIRLAEGPVAGYVGGIHRHVDVELLTALAKRRPDWSLVMVGPIQTRCDALLRLPNVHHLGPIDHQELASYIAGFDVGLVPYRGGEQTETVIPAKLGEYLAVGIPAVSTDLPAVRELGAHPAVVSIPDPSHDAFIAAVGEALALPRTGELTGLRRALAGAVASHGIAERIGELIEAAVEERAGVRRLQAPEARPAAGEAPAA
jgi:glycosyltransferase involved in cell wall biosynthesis